MTKVNDHLTKLPEDEKNILHNLVALPDFFSVDWFSGIPELTASKLFAVILFLDKQQWISPVKEQQGYYEWTKKFPRNEIVEKLSPQEMSKYYRNAVGILLKYLPDSEENNSIIAKQCLLSGIRTDDLDIIFRAAIFEEKNHKISSAIALYDSLLDFTENSIIEKSSDPHRNMLCTFIRTIERRAALSLFNPDLKKINHFLFTALDAAVDIGDKRALASLQLLVGQNYWMSFQYDKAVKHFDQGWEIIRQIGDNELYKRGMKLQGLSYWIKGDLRQAIESYEKSMGELESVADDDFSSLTDLGLALTYTQVGMPQRGLGISESIQKQSQKDENWPLVSYALVTTGKILLEIRQLKDSRTYFGRALELSRREHVPMAEVMAGIGLANIECLRGNYKAAAVHYKVIWKIRKSNWYHLLNLYHLFDTGYMLHAQNAFPGEMNPVFDFLNQLKKEQLNPLLYGQIQRLQLNFLETDMSPKEKIKKLTDIEKSVEKLGQTFELAKIRIDLATLFLQINDLKQAESYGIKAWEFLKPIARDAFPSKLSHLVSDSDVVEENQLFDFVIEMGEALKNQKNIESLLTNIITSISRLTRAERTAIFIKDKNSSEITMVASRNIVKEDVSDQKFKEVFKAIQSAVNNREGKIIQHETSGQDSGDFRNIVITPLKIGDKSVGVLYQDSRFFSFDTNSDKIRLLSALASQIAVSIDRAQAYDEIARLNESLIQENLYYKEEFRPFEDIIGSSYAVLDMQHLINKVAPTPSTVLIQGETGTGKELVAKAIHRTSARKDGPFIRVNCAALPDTLIDSELFGHEKGAFTGAVKTKAGRFELAHKGTIFLDEVSELPPSTQSRLLRILQEKEFQRVGGTTTLHSDFRLITATNKDLEKEVASGKFRADLFYRLNVFPISVAPLRKRKDDISLLATHFLNLFCSQHNKHYPGIPESEMEKLVTYSWPGNIRELSNMVERAVISGESRIRFPELESKKIAAVIGDKILDLKDMEKLQILKSLKKTNGKIGGKDGASVLLGLKRTTLIHRMKKLGIKVEKTPRDTIQ